MCAYVGYLNILYIYRILPLQHSNNYGLLWKRRLLDHKNLMSYTNKLLIYRNKLSRNRPYKSFYSRAIRPLFTGSHSAFLATVSKLIFNFLNRPIVQRNSSLEFRP